MHHPWNINGSPAAIWLAFIVFTIAGVARDVRNHIRERREGRDIRYPGDK